MGFVLPWVFRFLAFMTAAPDGWVGFTALFRGGDAESKGND